MNFSSPAVSDNYIPISIYGDEAEYTITKEKLLVILMSGSSAIVPWCMKAGATKTNYIYVPSRLRLSEVSPPTRIPMMCWRLDFQCVCSALNAS